MPRPGSSSTKQTAYSTQNPRPRSTGPGHVGKGRIFISEFTPCFEEMKSDGGIIIPGQVAQGKAFYKRKDDGSEELVQADSSVVYGFVTGSGLDIARGSCSIEPEALQGDFPLPVGTIVSITRSVDHTVFPSEKSYNSYDLQWHSLPTDPVPEWAMKAYRKYHAEAARANAM